MIKQITVQDLKERMNKKENFILIDVRELDEWNQGHIPGAHLMPLSAFPSFIDKLQDKNADIVLQCKVGGRSQRAAEYLESLGYTKLSNVNGGFTAWAANNFDITMD